MQISLLCSTEHKEENMIFVNSPFKILDEAFRGLYPDKKYKACIEPSIKDDEGNQRRMDSVRRPDAGGRRRCARVV